MCLQKWCICLLILSISAHAHGQYSDEDGEEEEMTEMEMMQSTIGSLSRQLIMTQLYMEESSRSRGDSGIKKIRGSTTGTRP